MSDTLQAVLTEYGNALGDPDEAALPPAVAQLGIAFEDYEPKKHLYAQCPASTDWVGLDGKLSRDWLVMCGGLTAHLLATLLAKKPCIALSSEAMHFRSAQASNRDLSIQARVKATRGSVMFLEVVFKDPDAKLIGRATYQYAVMKSKSRSPSSQEEDE